MPATFTHDPKFTAALRARCMESRKAYLEQIIADMKTAGLTFRDLALLTGFTDVKYLRKSLGNVGNCTLLMATVARAAVNAVLQHQGKRQPKKAATA